MQIDRLFKIVYMLMEDKSVTAMELSQQFGVSVRTIYRDIETLSLAGIPIYSNPGKGGGYKLLDKFVLNKSALTEEEQNHIVIALQNLSATQQVDVEGTLSKMSSLFQKNKVTWIEVDYTRWGIGRETDKDKFDLLRKGILGKHPILFSYVSSYGKHTRRRLEPVKLIFKSSAWYLQGYCRDKGAYRTFKVNRISKLEVLPEQFAEEHQSPPPLDENVEDIGKYPAITMRFHPAMAYRIYDEFTDEVIKQQEDGYYEVTVYMPEDNWLYGYLLSFGTLVEIIRPSSVKKKLAEEIKKLAELYQIKL